MLRRAVAGVLVVLATLVVLGPAFLGAPAHLAVVGSPADYGLRYEAIAFAPADRPIRLRAWRPRGARRSPPSSRIPRSPTPAPSRSRSPSRPSDGRRCWSSPSSGARNGFTGSRSRAARRSPPRAESPATTRALLIQNDDDPIVPVADARALAAAMPKAEVWITPAPPADHPLVGEQGAFGMHCQSYELDPRAATSRVASRFIPDSAAAFRSRRLPIL